MKLGLHQSVRMEQRLVQSPQMIQAMQILQLPALELEGRIEQELTENPFLEPVENESDGEEERPAEATDAETRGVESMLEELERYERDFGESSSPRPAPDDGEGDRKYEAMKNTPASGSTLAEAVIEQLAFLDFDERAREVAEFLIYSLDGRGYLQESLEDVAAGCPLGGVTPAELDGILAELRRVTHPALGATGLAEALLLQLEALEFHDPLAHTLVEHHLDDIVTNRLPRIAKATGHPIEDIKAALETIRSLDPSPGAEFGEELAAVIVPDVVVEEVDGQYEVRLTRQRTRELTLNPMYKRLLREARKGDGVQEWVKKRVESARWFIDAIQQRQSTLQRIATVIFDRQRGFLDRGVRGLAPLRMQEVADEVGVHISTVSRAVSGKHAQTPRGIYPLKFFFTGGTPRSTGGVASQASIKQRIAELVEQEDSAHPLSDDQLAAKLKELDGIAIARRTVTKYRKALEIPSSSQRKSF